MANSTKSGLLQNMSLSQSQHGAGVAGVMFFILAIGVFLKIGIAIVPAQIDDRNLSKLIAQELSLANANEVSPEEFLKKLEKRLSINAYYDLEPRDIIGFNNKVPGKLEVYKNYSVVNNFFGNVDIVNRFEGNIEPDRISDE